jgi:hypothetical protein
MKKRNFLLAAATATVLIATSYAVMADSGAQSGNVTVVGTSQSSNSSTSYVGSGGAQSAWSNGGPSAAGQTGGGIAAGAQANGNSLGAAAGGNAGFAYANSGHKGPKPPKPHPDYPVFSGGAGSPLSCTIKVSDFSQWRKLERKERRLALNCECLTVEPAGLARNANKDCPVNATEIFTATRN